MHITTKLGSLFVIADDVCNCIKTLSHASSFFQNTVLFFVHRQINLNVAVFTFCDFYVFNFTALSVTKISILSETRYRGIFVIRYWHGVSPITGTCCTVVDGGVVPHIFQGDLNPCIKISELQYAELFGIQYYL